MTGPKYATTTARGARVYDIPSPPLPHPLVAKSVTSILERGMNSIGLGIWKMNNAIGYAVDHLDELAGLDRETAVNRIKNESDDRSAASRGTAVHALAESIFLGRDLTTFEEAMYPDHAAHLRAFVSDFNIETIATERVVANYRPEYSGSFDLIAMVDGIPTLIDIKTGRVMAKAALQGAAYASAEWMLSEDGTEALPMPPVERVAVLQVTDEGYGYYPSDFSIPDLFSTFCAVAQVAAFESERGVIPAKPVDPGALPAYRTEVRTRLAQLIEWGGGEEMAAAWPKGIPTFRETDRHTTAQLDAIEYALRRVEHRHRPKPPAASRERHDELIAALTDHPHLDVIGTYAAALEVPNLRGYGASVDQLDVLERVVQVITKVPDPEDRAARLGRATNGRTTNPAEVTADELAAFMRTRATRKVTA